ncbi:MAG: nucleoside 2-deoxyribosyltransferase [Lachnospiraceae bacterium]
MYRYQHKLFEKESIYIAGPECFYTYGYDMLAAMRAKAESLGFGVTLPNDNPLDMENPDKQKRADSIFADLKAAINKTTVIIADLNEYRGAEADSGSVYEIGMAYAKGAKCYGYTRDKRSMAAKNQQGVLKNGVLYDERGGEMPYAQLSFSPAVIGSTKIVEGDFDDCLKMLMVDIEEEQKLKVLGGAIANRSETINKGEKKVPLIYLAGLERYDQSGGERFRLMKEICRKYGYEAVSPLDQAFGAETIDIKDPYVQAVNQFNHYQQHVRNCDIVIADLNDFRGYEISNDIGFECGMGFQLGKKLYGYMADTGNLIDKIPHLGQEREYRDQTGSNVENFDYPANLMFGCSMKIFQGAFEEIIENVVKDLNELEG